MGQPAEKQHRPATYADLDAVPEHLVAELLHGVLYTFPRPATPHTNAASYLAADLITPFGRGRGGPGGWHIYVDPRLHLGPHVLVPDLAGWRRERVPQMPRAPAITIAPDWLCEVLSPSTAAHDRIRKMPMYAAANVPWLWLVDPLLRTLEVFHLNASGWYEQQQAFADDEVVRAQPFADIALELAGWWEGVAPEGDAAPGT
ncbi:Uma2 family endonuclease [Chondromyces apiculatus]|uniref:Putative restriction endonuclease domain-containing protein n=1 Tax=Chondromyces apiculatus DSM 436 TaxID=1192034 RepID=A0A017SWP7_9BACT|nr:Uma2 family endonuclease [Chondromyces apiculatus]EYF00746.1 Hypothetical protein CAP_0314 [Chondromyces apiculatus DSM 436]